MAEPKCYHRGLYSRPQQSHRGAMTQHMHADGFLSQRRTGAGGYLNVFGEPMCNGVPAEGRPRTGDEEWLRRLSSALAKPNTQEADHNRGHPGAPPLLSRPHAADAPTPAQIHL